MRNSNLLAALLLWGLLAFSRQLAKDLRQLRILQFASGLLLTHGMGRLVCCSLGEKAFSLARAGNLHRDLDSTRAD